MLVPRLRGWLSLLRSTPLHPQWLLGSHKRLVEFIQIHASGIVLDVGCADRWLEQNLGPDCRYIALDYPETGRYMYKARPDIFGDASQLPISDASVDVVTMLDVVEHLFCPQEAFEEVARVLKPGGVVLVSIPFLYPIHDAPHDFQRYTAHGLAREIKIAGLKLGSIEPSLGSSETAGLIGTLALGGTATEALRKRRISLLLVPLIVVLIPMINVLAWVFGRLLPTWPALTAGYIVVASKP